MIDFRGFLSFFFFLVGEEHGAGSRLERDKRHSSSFLGIPGNSPDFETIHFYFNRTNKKFL